MATSALLHPAATCHWLARRRSQRLTNGRRHAPEGGTGAYLKRPACRKQVSLRTWAYADWLRMAKQKRKAPQLMEKKSKKQKKEGAAVAEVRLHRQKASSEGAAGSSVQDSDPELSPEERRVLERKLKKERKKEEKKRLREAVIATVQALPAKRSGAELALDYLYGWARKDASWRFQKTRQTWLLLHMYDRDKVPDEHFSTLLAYLEGLKGQARELTVQKAEAQMQELDEVSEDAALLEKAGRLRQVLQLLS
ncbi:PREDICTED: uncharacterized protein C7orf50 homolog [Dipodomys ordii]|uniref:Uncharacterized protein C7orf50 homolog n=1 Tax=Dipodomys ordii TaxID=10020 RepID=A0A1S3FSJ5_DIPOR|nr:PREDICTED: uncharacterized protein C7orf50 homolog [Dipodomys ordii]